MPTISIDTFFACTLMVSVVAISTALLAQTLNAHVNSLQNLNENEYFRAVSENILLSCGTPRDWGSQITSVPEALGLANSDSLCPYELDIDKVSRLNSQSAFALPYPKILDATNLNDEAFGISVSQLLDISTVLVSNSTSIDSTTYTFKISASQDGAPVATSLHCYTIARDFLCDSYNETSTTGASYVRVEIPNASNGTAAFVIFARASHDPRITVYEVYSFGHLSTEPLLPNSTFLRLSPLNNTLSLSSDYPNETLGNCYALSYAYHSDLASTPNATYTIPEVLDQGPKVLIVSGSNASTPFVEWTAYPQVPFETGASFANSECYAFSYVVTIKNTLYELTMRFGGLDHWNS